MNVMAAISHGNGSFAGLLIRSSGLPAWVAAAIVGAIVQVALFVAITADDQWAQASGWVFWRSRLLHCTTIAYIMLVYPIMIKFREGATDALEAITANKTDPSRQQRAIAIPGGRLWELTTIAIWLGIGYFSYAPWKSFPGQTWQTAWTYPATVLMWVLIGTVIYEAVYGMVTITRRFRQPLEIDLFASSNFNSTIRWSLFVSTATLIGAAVAVVFVDPVYLAQPRVYSVFIFLILISVGVFFGTMRKVNHAISKKRDSEVLQLSRRVSTSAAKLKAAKKGPDEVEARRELVDWLLYERRLREVSVWPINIGTMVRLGVSAAIPGIAYLAKLLLNAEN